MNHTDTAVLAAVLALTVGVLLVILSLVLERLDEYRRRLEEANEDLWHTEKLLQAIRTPVREIESAELYDQDRPLISSTFLNGPRFDALRNAMSSSSWTTITPRHDHTPNREQEVTR